MKIGFAAWGLRETPLPEQLSLTAKYHLPLLEISIGGHPNDFLQANAAPEQIEQAKKLFTSNKLVPFAGAIGNDFLLPEKADNLKQLEYAVQAITIAGKLGLKSIRIFAGFAPAETVKKRQFAFLLEALQICCQHAGQHGINCCLETHGAVTVLPDDSVRHSHSVSTVKKTLIEILDAIPELRINFDPANLHILGVDTVDFFHCLRGKIAYAHLKDFVPRGSGFIPAACGKGSLPWEILLPELAAMDIPALLEYEITDDVEAGFAESLTFIRGMIPC